MPNSFDLPINPLNGSTLEVKSDDASALTGTEKVLIVQNGIKETTTQAIADLGGGGSSYLVYTASFKQLGTSVPTSPTVFENTLGGVQSFSRSSAGNYTLSGIGDSNINKIYINGFGNYDDTGLPCMPILSNSAIIGYYSVFPASADTLNIQFVNELFAPTDFSAIFGLTDIIYLPKIEVYP